MHFQKTAKGIPKAFNENNAEEKGKWYEKIGSCFVYLPS